VYYTSASSETREFLAGIFLFFSPSSSDRNPSWTLDQRTGASSRWYCGLQSTAGTSLLVDKPAVLEALCGITVAFAKLKTAGTEIVAASSGTPAQQERKHDTDAGKEDYRYIFPSRTCCSRVGNKERKTERQVSRSVSYRQYAFRTGKNVAKAAKPTGKPRPNPTRHIPRQQKETLPESASFFYHLLSHTRNPIHHSPISPHGCQFPLLVKFKTQKWLKSPCVQAPVSLLPRFHTDAAQFLSSLCRQHFDSQFHVSMRDFQNFERFCSIKAHHDHLICFFLVCHRAISTATCARPAHGIHQNDR
jgi:hypothetical protein